MTKNLNLFLEYLKLEKNYSNNTINSYEKDINEFITFLNINKISNPKYNDIRNYLSYMFEKKI